MLETENQAWDGIRQGGLITIKQKRKNGSGSVCRLKNGYWRGRLMIGYKEDGTRNIVSFTASSREGAEEMIRQYQYQMQTPNLCDGGDGTFRSVAEIWYNDYRTQVQPSTHANYIHTLHRLERYFGEEQISTIRPFHINRYMDYLSQQELSQSYKTKCRAMLIQIFDFAQANELVHSNPARLAKAIRTQRTAETKEEAVTPKKDAFTPAEQALLMEHLPDSLIGHSIRLLIGSGLRTQELLALRPEDIAEDGSSVSVTKAIQMVNGQPQLGPPKSKRGKRMIPIARQYRASAVFLREHPRGKVYIWSGKRRESGLYDPNIFRSCYQYALSHVPGVRTLTPHCCRHTYVSNLERCGVSMELIARLAGHSKIQTTDGYLHTEMDVLAQAVAKLNA